MKCHDFVDFLIDYLEGQLPVEQRVVFEQHLQHCACCGYYLRTYQLTIELGRSVCRCSDDVAAHDVPEALVQAILAACRQRPDASS